MHPVLIEIPIPSFLRTLGMPEILITLAVLVAAVAVSRAVLRKRLDTQQLVVGAIVYGVIRYLLYAEAPDSLKLHTYGVLVATGFVVGISLAVREARRQEPKGKLAERVLDLTFWILIAAMLGSRVLFIIVNWHDYARDPLAMFRIWQGGLVFYGGFLGALFFSIWYMRRHRMNFFQVADILIPSVSIGHFFGRLGCFSAGCCWGKVTDVAWSVQFPKGSLAWNGQEARGVIGAMDAHTLAVHPTQLYEAVGELGIFLLLLLLRGRKRFHGQLLLTYLIIYPILRSVVEVFRGDVERGALLTTAEGTIIISTSQFISMLVAGGAIGLIIFFARRRRSAAPAPAKNEG